MPYQKWDVIHLIKKQLTFKSVAFFYYPFKHKLKYLNT